ncbi:hypothetical protein Tco_0966869 [Tanacetum coccineum]
MSQPANDEFSQHLSDDEASNHEDASDTGAAPKQKQHGSLKQLQLKYQIPILYDVLESTSRYQEASSCPVRWTKSKGTAPPSPHKNPSYLNALRPTEPRPDGAFHGPMDDAKRIRKPYKEFGLPGGGGVNLVICNAQFKKILKKSLKRIFLSRSGNAGKEKEHVNKNACGQLDAGIVNLRDQQS